MSKSLGNAADPFDLARAYGSDEMRYFFLRETPFGEDGVYSRTGLARRIEGDLSNDLGNLAQRSLSLVERHCGGKVPSDAALGEEGKGEISAVEGLVSVVSKAMDDLRPDRALAAVFERVSALNRFFTREEPWALLKKDRERGEGVLYVTLESLRQTALLLLPFIPTKGGEILDQLSVEKKERRFAFLGEKGRLRSGVRLPPPSPVFPKRKGREEDAGG